jgi:hypothetical protein
MPKNNEITFEQYFQLPNPGLRSYFDIVRRGQPDEYRTTFAKGSSVEEVLQEWKPQLDTLSDKWPTLVEFEDDLFTKVGPMSIMKPLAQRMDDIDAYYDGILLPSKPISDSAVKAVIKEWNPTRGLFMRKQIATVNVMKKSTNSGSPYFAKRRNVVQQTIPCLVSHDGPFAYQQLVSKVWKACAVLGWRGQEGGRLPENVKQRIIWMFPFAVNIQELQIYQPLIESAQYFNLVPAWVSMEAVDQGITQLFDTKGPNDLIVCTDFSKFDQHFNEHLASCAADVIRSIFVDAEEWLQHVFPIKYMIPLAYDYGRVRTGRHGMGSGSGGTNVDETLAHRALQYEAAQSAGQRLNPFSACLGDDGILSYPGITTEQVTASYVAHGLEMNASKQYASTSDCTYLRRWHHQDYRVNHVCVGVYSTYRALGRLMEQERFFDPEVWSEKMVALRQLSIIENVKWHPLRDKFAEFCMARDKFRLGIDLPGFLNNIERIAQEAIELMPDFLGYTKTSMSTNVGIGEWWIVKYLKSK